MADAVDPGTGATDDGKGGAAAAGTEPKPAVTFKTEGEFLAAAAKKAKTEVAKAIEATRSEILGALGVESIEELTAVKERLATTEKQVTEAEKLKASYDKTNRELEKERKRSGDLSGRLIKIAKRDALLPFVGQVVDPEVLTMLLDPLLEVDEEGSVSVKDGRALENVVEDLLKKREYLKKPSAKDGAGTAATEPRVKANDGKKGDAAPNPDPTVLASGSNGAPPKFKSIGEKWMADLKIPKPAAGGGP
jgi:hypothetical protein